MLTTALVVLAFVLALVFVLRATDLQVTASVLDNNTGLTFTGASALAVAQAGGNKRSVEDILLVNTTDTTIPLLSAGTLGYAVFLNLDPTNPIDLKVAAAGTIIARLDANGGCALLKIGSGITAPVAIANTATCRMRYKIWEA